MKIDVTQVLTKLDGTELTTQVQDIQLCDECADKLRNAQNPLTLRLVCTRALTLITPDNQNISGEDKFERGALARKIYENDTPNLKPTDIVLLMKIIGQIQGPLVVLRTYELLDPPEAK